MNITYIKFFQPVDIERNLGGTDLRTWARNTEYTIEQLDNGLISITPKGGTVKTIVTLNNVCYLKVTDDANTKTNKSSKTASRETKEEAKPS